MQNNISKPEIEITEFVKKMIDSGEYTQDQEALKQILSLLEDGGMEKEGNASKLDKLFESLSEKAQEAMGDFSDEILSDLDQEIKNIDADLEAAMSDLDEILADDVEIDNEDKKKAAE